MAILAKEELQLLKDTAALLQKHGKRSESERRTVEAFCAYVADAEEKYLEFCEKRNARMKKYRGDPKNKERLREQHTESMRRYRAKKRYENSDSEGE